MFINKLIFKYLKLIITKLKKKKERADQREFRPRPNALV